MRPKKLNCIIVASQDIGTLVFIRQLPIIITISQDMHLMIGEGVKKNRILSLKMKGDVISGQSLMLWFQKDSVDIVGFGTFRVGSGFPKLLRSIFPLCES